MLGVILAFVLLASSSCGTSRQAESADVTVAHWGHERVFIYFPLYVAMRKGYFADEGINVKLLFSGNDDQVFASVIAGQAQFGLADPVFTAISREKGGPGKVIGTLVGRVSNWGVGKSKAIPRIDDLSQLDGMRVSTFPSPSTAYTIIEDIRTTRRLRRLSIVQLTPGAEIAAMERGDVDIAVTGEPAVSLAEHRGYPVVLSMAEYYGPFAFSGVTTTEEVLAQHPELAQALISGLQRAVEFAHDSSEAAADLVALEFPSVPREVVRTAVRRMVSDRSIPANVEVTDSAWRRTLEMRRKLGDLKEVDLRSSVDNEFAFNASDTARRSALRQRRLQGRSVQTTKSDAWVWLGRSADIATLAIFLASLTLYLIWRIERERPPIDTQTRLVGEAVLRLFQERDWRPITHGDLVTKLAYLDVGGERLGQILDFFARSQCFESTVTAGEKSIQLRKRLLKRELQLAYVLATRTYTNREPE